MNVLYCYSYIFYSKIIILNFTCSLLFISKLNIKIISKNNLKMKKIDSKLHQSDYNQLICPIHKKLLTVDKNLRLKQFTCHKGRHTTYTPYYY